jgi:DNA polymerase-3 subunit gamma/tau
MKPDFSEKSQFKDKPKVSLKITDLTKVDKKESNNDANQQNANADQPFTPEQLKAAWTEYIDLRKNFKMEQILLTQPYELSSNNQITLNFTSTEETFFDSMKMELATFLRAKLKNNSITIVGNLVVRDETKMPLTRKEKFEYMVAQNPLLKELKDRLLLDPDY